MNQREQLAGRAEDYILGHGDGFEAGREYERGRIRRIEWSKLFGVVVAGSVIGCGIILAIAVGLSNL
jgi:hypothetical protein